MASKSKSESALMRGAIRSQFRGLMKDIGALFKLSYRVGSWPVGSKVKVTVNTNTGVQDVVVGMKKIQATFTDWKKRMTKTLEMSLKFKRVNPRMFTTNWYSNQLTEFLAKAFTPPVAPTGMENIQQRTTIYNEAKRGYDNMVALFKSRGQTYDPSKFKTITDGIATHNIITLLFTLYGKTHVAPGDESTLGLKSPEEARRIRYDNLMAAYFGSTDTKLNISLFNSRGGREDYDIKTDASDKIADRRRSAFSLIQFGDDGKTEAVTTNRKGERVPAFIPRGTNLKRYGFMMASIMKIASFFRVKPEWLPAEAKAVQPIQISPAGKDAIKRVKEELLERRKLTGAPMKSADDTIMEQYNAVVASGLLTDPLDRKAYDIQYSVWQASKYARELNELVDPTASKKNKGKPKQESLDTMLANARAVTPPKKVKKAASRTLAVQPVAVPSAMPSLPMTTPRSPRPLL